MRKKGITIKSLHEILEVLIESGYGDCELVFPENSPMAFLNKTPCRDLLEFHRF